MLTGKGMYVWDIERAEGGDIVELVGKAKVAGMTHLLLKIADGKVDHNVADDGTDYANLLADKCKQHGIEPWGWQYTYGLDPSGEAQKANERVEETGVVGFVINAEKEYKNNPGKAANYIAAIEMPVPVGLSSYRYPVKYHYDFPWSEFLDGCDFVMPQIYWVKGDPVDNLTGTRNDYDLLWEKLGYNLPLFPTGSAYNRTDWAATADEVQRFMEACEQVELPGVNFWEWSEMKENGLWPTIRDYSWPVEEPSEPEPTLEERVSMLEKQDQEIISGYVGLREDLTAVEDTLKTLEQNLTDFSARLENRFTSIEENVVLWEHLDPQLKSISERLSENQAKTSALQSRVDDLGRVQKDNSQEITDLQSQDEMLKKNIANVLDNVMGEIKLLEEGLSLEITGLMKRDSKINQRITSETSEISGKIEALVRGFEEEIDRLDKRIDNLPSGGSGNNQEKCGLFDWLRGIFK